MIPTTQHLDLIINRWHDLHDALAPSGGRAAWPPTGLLITYLRQLEDAESQRAARDGSGTGEHAAPLVIDVLDTMRAVEAALVTLADQIAAQIQRPSMSHAPRDWPPTDRARRDQRADEDAADPRRWRYIGQRTAPYAAAWLAARLEAIPGPFGPLPETEAARIARVAAGAAERILGALGEAQRAAKVARPCHCTGTLYVYGGGGTTPYVRCDTCGWTQTAATAAA
ncbi:MAG TPA: hypothetical protein DEQ61_13130 [Streptomyces sp.]|nr:hypothetical protein [Streptomyces sp.]